MKPDMKFHQKRILLARWLCLLILPVTAACGADRGLSPQPHENPYKYQEAGKARMGSRLQQMLADYADGKGAWLELAQGYGFMTDEGLLLELQLEEDTVNIEKNLKNLGVAVTFLSLKYRRATVSVSSPEEIDSIRRLEGIRSVDPLYPPVRR